MTMNKLWMKIAQWRVNYALKGFGTSKSRIDGAIRFLEGLIGATEEEIGRKEDEIQIIESEIEDDETFVHDLGIEKSRLEGVGERINEFTR